MSIRSLIPALLVSPVSVSCETNCTPTETTAQEAAVANLVDVTASAVLVAVLSSGGGPLSGKTIEFTVHQINEDEFVGEATTGDDGVARLDLKERPTSLARGVLSDSYEALFDGDSEFCASSDRAEFRLVQAP